MHIQSCLQSRQALLEVTVVLRERREDREPTFHSGLCLWRERDLAKVLRATGLQAQIHLFKIYSETFWTQAKRKDKTIHGHC